MRGETHRITRVVPPVWLILIMIAMYALHGMVPVARVFVPAFAVAGQVLLFVGFSLAFYAARQFKEAKTPLKPFVPVKALVTEGPFRYSRNPVYLGMFMIIGGWAIYLGSLTPWLGALGFIAMICRYWVPKEEVQMERQMGEAYLDYKQKVRRWL